MRYPMVMIHQANVVGVMDPVVAGRSTVLPLVTISATGELLLFKDGLPANALACPTPLLISSILLLSTFSAAGGLLLLKVGPPSSALVRPSPQLFSSVLLLVAILFDASRSFADFN